MPPGEPARFQGCWASMKYVGSGGGRGCHGEDTCILHQARLRGGGGGGGVVSDVVKNSCLAGRPEDTLFQI